MAKGDFSVNKKAAPIKWVAFKRWHKLACKRDDLTAEQRFIKLGYKLPKDEHTTTDKKK